MQQKITVENDPLDYGNVNFRSTVITEDGVGFFINYDNYLTIYNFNGLDTDKEEANCYLR